MLEFTPARFVPRRHLANGEVLRVTMDVSKVTQAFVLGWFAAFRSGKYSPPWQRDFMVGYIVEGRLQFPGSE